MLPTDPNAPQLIPSWIFEQDFLVFLSFFGWMLVGLLALSKPLSKNGGARLPWLWIGFYAFSQAVSDFLRTLSFSDEFFRTFNLEVGFEMLGYGLLVETAIRYAKKDEERYFFPYSALGGLFLGLSIEIGDLLYTLVVSFLVSAGAVFWAGRVFARAAMEEKRRELYAIVAGLALLFPTWLLAPGRLDALMTDQSVAYEDFPYYGFDLLLLRIVAGWTILAGFWYYRLQRRIEDVVPQIGNQLRLWGHRVLPVALGLVVGASFLVTSWNGQRMKDRMSQDYLSRVQTAAVPMDVAEIGTLDEILADGRRLDGAIAGQLLGIKRVGSDVRSVYLWNGDGDGIRTAAFETEQSEQPFLAKSHLKLSALDGFDSGEAFLAGPFAAGGESLMFLSAPIRDRSTGEIAYWLGIDVSGAAWFRNVSLSRLQTIIIAGLIMALVIFFLYYQIEHESEADLILAKERAEAGDRAKSEFLAVISHEIRTPLQSVLGYSDLLKGTRLDEKQRACLDTIQSEGKILLRIVQDILDFSNLRKASFQLEYGPVRLRRLIEETFRTIKPMADRKGLKAHLEITQEVPELVKADAVRLRQVLLNLFGNSVKYTEEGEVFLKAFVDDKDDALPLKFEILDTGVGIKEADLVRLFEPFIQLEHSSKFPREGAGLGLAIVNRIVELMGGRIDVQSEVGKGSCFTASFAFEALELEAGESNELAGTEVEEEDEFPMGQLYPLKILVVDDNPMVRRLILQYLEALGYEADECDGGQVAADRGLEYDLLIMDLRMPGVDGPTAASMLREKGGAAERPWIIAVSASLQEDEVKRARDAGVNDFLGKPFYAGQLGETIEAIAWIEEKRVDPDSIVGESAAAAPEPEHVPLFIGPAREEEPEEEIEPAAKPAIPQTVFGGIDSYPEEAVKAAVAEVYSKHRDMEASAQKGDWFMVKEDAHYLANTAMALGIDQLYLDSKDVENAALAEDAEKVAKGLLELKLNFEAWESDE
ncbi:response regulator [Pelagicoccus sp. NFK12]|uniref:histidine kinase n=1 Tax=Pelagicoccus enzymogenes TaxID=2773457 RepID=A0A927IGX8_9BACT|nr:ATP-binding protein [Pelagicoccus enzymogenes]MBD5779626.1 response regulator [Pelagicoccus enzymogenes]